MAPDFVRYSPELETIAPDIEQLLPQLIEFWEKKGVNRRGSRATGARPAAHIRSPTAS